MLTEIKNQPIPALDRRFLVKIDDKEFVLYDGLLDLAHKHGLQKLMVKHIQLPSRDNGMECICRATAITGSGNVFTDIGDANPQNTDQVVSRHLIRMASTRSKARVLRDLTNIGMTALEELGGDANAMPGNGMGASLPKANAGNTAAPFKAINGGVKVPMTEAQERAIWALGKKQGHDRVSMDNLAKARFGDVVADLGKKDASSLITHLKQVGGF